MAELVGTVASGISIATIAVQIAQSISKLKFYWDEVKDAPSDISLLIEEIDTLQHLLEDIQDIQHRDDEFSVLKRRSIVNLKCLELCTKGSHALREVVEELIVEIQDSKRVKKQWVLAKFVFRKDRVEKHRARLERAVRFLGLAYQIHTRDLIFLQPQLIVARLKDAANDDRAWHNGEGKRPMTISNVFTQSRELSNSTTDVFQIQRTKRCYKTRTRILKGRFQTWFGNSAWEFLLITSQRGWKIELRIQNIRPYDAEVFQMSENGDIQGLRKLFEEGLASPLDITLRGKNALTIAMRSGQLETYQFLSSQGADIDEQYIGIEPVSAQLWQLLNNGCVGTTDTSFFITIIEMLKEETQVELDTYELLLGFRGPLGALVYIMGQIQASGVIFTPERCIELAIRFATEAPFNNAHTVRCALASGRVTQVLDQRVRNGANGVSHAVVYAIGSMFRLHGSHVSKSKLHTMFNIEEDLNDWRNLLQELLANGATPFSESSSPFFPRHDNFVKRSCFLMIFDGFFNNNIIESNLDTLQILPEIWATEIERAGFNLLEAGWWETQWQIKNPESKNFVITINDFSCKGCSIQHDFKIYGFTYGPKPSDWNVWISDPRDDFVGDFWNLIENPDGPELPIPGMWVE